MIPFAAFNAGTRRARAAYWSENHCPCCGVLTGRYWGHPVVCERCKKAS